MKAVRNLLIYIFSTYLLVMFGFNAAQDFWCSTLVKGVIYGSYSVSEMFPKNFTNCTWTLENPDPTKYSIYLKFSKKDFSCSNFSLLAYQFDHFSHEKIKDLLKNNHSIMQLCNSKNAFVFLQYDKNFIQIRRVYPINFPGLHKKEEDQKSFFEFLVLNKVSPSQFGCHVLCTWLESCLKSENGRTESCGIMYTKCTCPQHLGEWGIDDQSLVLLNNVVLPLNEQTEGCLTQELQTTQVCNLTREAKRPPKEAKPQCCGRRKAELAPAAAVPAAKGRAGGGEGWRVGRLEHPVAPRSPAPGSPGSERFQGTGEARLPQTSPRKARSAAGMVFNIF
ncbi:PREDICTED: adhesion G protein-coupled receptor B3-like [Sturnus vulgaris]|uniref:adhesion G protein-coupled receptor B3-like n=1 Tax=Sturnus vulgaris TaxID=9172 RepID=UPI00071A1829|nr:PREDICTED: adhesion G protein-coupled receptor B3-like [Sturnus vulgaris]